ncbi:MAG TPA: hypothetical protein VGT05_00505 [Patescibacteria group bacterium]|nr:hypothetical protein [Patescibacteria group bacterium]
MVIPHEQHRRSSLDGWQEQQEKIYSKEREEFEESRRRIQELRAESLQGIQPAQSVVSTPQVAQGQDTARQTQNREYIGSGRTAPVSTRFASRSALSAKPFSTGLPDSSYSNPIPSVSLTQGTPVAETPSSVTHQPPPSFRRILGEGEMDITGFFDTGYPDVHRPQKNHFLPNEAIMKTFGLAQSTESQDDGQLSYQEKQKQAAEGILLRLCIMESQRRGSEQFRKPMHAYTPNPYAHPAVRNQPATLKEDIDKLPTQPLLPVRQPVSLPAQSSQSHRGGYLRKGWKKVTKFFNHVVGNIVVNR